MEREVLAGRQTRRVRRGDRQRELPFADGPRRSDQQGVAGPYRFAEFPSWRRDGKNEVYFSAIEQGRDDADIYSYDLDTHEVKTRISTPTPTRARTSRTTARR